MPHGLILRLAADELGRAAEGTEDTGESPLLAIELRKEPGATATYKLVVTAGSETETYEGLTLKKGRNNIGTQVNAASKLIKIEETGESLPEG
jgi:hypothetical protein